MKNAAKKAAKATTKKAGKAVAKAAFTETVKAIEDKAAALKDNLGEITSEPELGNVQGVTLVSGTASEKKELKRLLKADKAKNKAFKAVRAAQKATKKAAAQEKPVAKLEGKGATILALVQRKGGATAAELQQATGWQPHSVRGFLSTSNKKYGTGIVSAKREDGARVYSVRA